MPPHCSLNANAFQQIFKGQASATIRLVGGDLDGSAAGETEALCLGVLNGCFYNE
jgi:hypothetical protein